jgi:hypothetical protein
MAMRQARAEGAIRFARRGAPRVGLTQLSETANTGALPVTGRTDVAVSS